MRVMVEYRCPVLVTVDTETQEIESVIVADEDVREHEPPIGWLVDDDEAATPPVEQSAPADLTTRAYEVTTRTAWPAWEIGL